MLLSPWPDRTHTSKIKPDFALDQSTQRQYRAALYSYTVCLSDRSLICVCVCLGVTDWVFACLSLCLSEGVIASFCLLFRVSVCQLVSVILVFRQKHTQKWRRCLLFTLLFVCLKRTADYVDFLNVRLTD